jgi:DNA-directed RNA polymerase subunit RPC12/RpoP
MIASALQVQLELFTMEQPKPAKKPKPKKKPAIYRCTKCGATIEEGDVPIQVAICKCGRRMERAGE